MKSLLQKIIIALAVLVIAGGSTLMVQGCPENDWEAPEQVDPEDDWEDDF